MLPPRPPHRYTRDAAVRVFVSDHHEFPLPPGHRFPASKYRLLRELLLAEGILRPAELLPAPLAGADLLAAAHDPAYVDSVRSGSLEPRVQRAIGLPWSRQLYDRSLASVGGALASAQAAIEDGIAGNLAGGTHHARRDAGAGFCVFNDLAVVALTLLSRGAVAKVAIVDLDVHQGDGNGALLGGVPGVLLLDLYCESNYPARKVPAGDAVGLPDGITDREYLDVLAEHLPGVLAADLVLYLAGVDPLASDRLGRLSLSAKALQARDAMVLESCRDRGIPVSLALGGGYADPIADSVAAHAATYRVARALHR